ncbi:hypothetical protein ANCCEY_12567 [Ancylostoma ceylanicum]|uniref:Uncharacterized protein n=1 Tax=Ancylostoma ceylanicum TaxID=53326 RepID=A0A0D6L9G1_9BILA|nr:hypothetical protein ANCCEY_12567 [Ancylostoma ceylanicum]
MSEAEQRLMPGPEGRTPHHYDVDRGVKTESYITAVSRNPVPPIHPPAKGVTYNKLIKLDLVNLNKFGPKSQPEILDTIHNVGEQWENFV